MSSSAVGWALDQQPGRLSDKMILILLGECHNINTGTSYPSQAWLAERGVMDIKTVTAGLERLEKDGLIRDTGRRVGRTKQVKVYELNLNNSEWWSDPSESGKEPENGTLSDVDGKPTENGGVPADIVMKVKTTVFSGKTTENGGRKQEGNKYISPTETTSPTESAGAGAGAREERKRKKQAPSAKPKDDPFPRPADVDAQVWQDFLTNRKRKSLPNTATAHKRLMNDLTRIAGQTGMSQPELIEYAAGKGWGGIYAPNETKGYSNGHRNGQQAPDGREIGRGEAAAREIVRRIQEDETARAGGGGSSPVSLPYLGRPNGHDGSGPH